jgi:hypothetical protein
MPSPQRPPAPPEALHPLPPNLPPMIEIRHRKYHHAIRLRGEAEVEARMDLAALAEVKEQERAERQRLVEALAAVA